MKNFFKKIWKGIKNFISNLGGSDSEIQYPIEDNTKEPVEEIPQKELFSSLADIPVGATGIDISHHNKKVDLKEVKKGSAFVYMKATEGESFVSNVYHQRMNEAISLGILCGAYHYYRINVDPIVQAKHFCKHIKGDLPPVLDIEAINNDGYVASKHTADLKKFLNYVELTTGKIPVIYSGFYFLRDVVKPDASFARYPLWLSWYTADRKRVKVPAPWDRITIWQFTETGSAQGVTGNVDVNLFEGLSPETIRLAHINSQENLLGRLI